MIAIDILNAAPYNPRRISDDALRGLAESIKRFSASVKTTKDNSGEYRLQTTITVNKNGNRIIGGHQRVKALELLGQSHIHAKDITWVEYEPDSADEKAANVSLNNRHIEGEWDDSLPSLLKDIRLDFDGFEDVGLGKLLDEVEPPAQEVVEDEVPDVQPDVITKPGDLWLCGEHRVLCGDATKADDYMRLLDGTTPNAIVTDPPYGVGVAYESFADDEDSVRELIAKFMPILLAFDCPLALTPGQPAMWVYPLPAWVGSWNHPAGNGRCSWGFLQNTVIMYFGKDPYLASGLGARPDSIVVACDRQGEGGHPTPKPIKAWAWLVKRVTTASGQLVLDPFLGSGTTLIAAEQLGRRCYGVEIEPKYVDVICRRWAKLTGKTPVLEDGTPFPLDSQEACCSQ